MLYNYRKNCGQSNNPSQLVLPEMLRLYPLYMLSALKSSVSNTNFSYFNIQTPQTNLGFQAYLIIIPFITEGREFYPKILNILSYYSVSACSQCAN